MDRQSRAGIRGFNCTTFDAARIRQPAAKQSNGMTAP
jgi:hypothetical protein